MHGWGREEPKKKVGTVFNGFLCEWCRVAALGIFSRAHDGMLMGSWVLAVFFSGLVTWRG